MSNRSGFTHSDTQRLRRLLGALVLAPTFLLAALPATAPAQTEARGLNLPNQTPAHYYALVIGNNAYTALPKLKTAEGDAREVERLLREAYGFQTKLLVNATRAQIVSALSTYRRELNADANLLIYYAGHGFNDKETEKTYWLPVDAERDDSSNWIIADEITSGIRAIPARHVLVVSDSCYSGTLTRGIGEMLPRPTERDQFLQRMAAGRSRTLMASGGDEPVADSGSGGHSVFAAALLRGLQAMDKGQFTAAELFRSYIEEAVAGRAQQTPEYNPLRNSGHEAGDFVFDKTLAGGKSAEPAVKSPVPVAPVTSLAVELSYWDTIKNSADPEDFRAYLAKYPDGQFADLARRRAQPIAGNTRALNSAPARPAANAAPERGPTASMQNVRDYFFWLPEQYLAVPVAQRADLLTNAGTIVDLKNGYLSFQPDPTMRTAVAVFKLAPGTHLIAISSVGPDPRPAAAARTNSQLVFLRYGQGQWRDVTKATLPVPFDPALKYELPRYGTTIVVTNQAGDKVCELIWTKSNFTLKPTH